MTTNNLIVLALIVVMMADWTIAVRWISRKGALRAAELAELPRNR